MTPRYLAELLQVASHVIGRRIIRPRTLTGRSGSMKKLTSSHYFKNQ